MKIIHVRNKKEVDITSLITDIKWSGDSKQVARVLSFGILASSTDKNIPVLDIKLGDMVKMLDGSKEKYRGYVFTKDKSLSGNEIDITSFDGLIYLLKSKGTYNFKGVRPGDIARRVCKDFGIPIGSVRDGTPIKRIFNNEDIYSIIMTAYTFESNRTKKKYMPSMKRGQFSMLEKGKKTVSFELDPSTTVMDAKYSESMESSINVVKVYDDNGNYNGEVKLSGIPGRLQDIYEGEDGKAGARSLLKGIEKTASIDALGDFECVTGNGVRVKEEHTGLVGLFFIDSDTHTFANGVHTMSLGLSFQNIMDRQMSGDDPDEIARRNAESINNEAGDKVQGTGKARVWSFLKSKGCTNEAAAGIMGNLQQESNIDPTKKQYGGGKGRGIMQWSIGSDRWDTLVALAKRRGTSWANLDTQLEFMWSEIQKEATAVSKLKRKYKMTPTQLVKLTNINRVTTIFEDCYERAGNKQMSKRINYAKGFYNKYKNMSNKTKSSTSSSSGGVSQKNKFLNAAKSMIGYSYSQSNRMGNRSADCSSLVGRAMKMAGITNNAQLTTASIIGDKRFTKISKRNAKEGDILWERGHMGIHMGGNRTLEARWSTKKVGYSSLGNRFTHAYRIKGI